MNSEHSQPTSETHTGGKTSRVKQKILAQAKATVSKLEGDRRSVQYCLDNSFFEDAYTERIMQKELDSIKQNLDCFNRMVEQLQQELS